jgi:hypothetical protein
MSASSRTYREASDRGISMVLLEPVDSLGILFLDCRPTLHRMQPLPHYKVPQMQWPHPGLWDHCHPPNHGMKTMTPATRLRA